MLFYLMLVSVLGCGACWEKVCIMKWLNHAFSNNQSHAVSAMQKSCSSYERSSQIQNFFWILYFLEGLWIKKRIWLRPVLLSCMPRARYDHIHILLVSLQTENNFAVWFYALKKIIHTVTALQNISILILYMLLAMTAVQKKTLYWISSYGKG